MHDSTEAIRRTMVNQINESPSSRELLESEHGQVWNTTELQQDFQALGFAAPFIIVERKSDNQKGTLTFQHDPRFYYDFTPTNL